MRREGKGRGAGSEKERDAGAQTRRRGGEEGGREGGVKSCASSSYIVSQSVGHPQQTDRPSSYATPTLAGRKEKERNGTP